MTNSIPMMLPQNIKMIADHVSGGWDAAPASNMLWPEKAPAIIKMVDGIFIRPLTPNARARVYERPTIEGSNVLRLVMSISLRHFCVDSSYEGNLQVECIAVMVLKHICHNYDL